jgi:hypothetical protein
MMTTEPKNNAQPLDYSDVPPEHDGSQYRTPPVGWTPPISNPIPKVEGVSQAVYDSVVRKLVLPHEEFWRRHAHNLGFRALIEDKRDAERKLLAEAFQLDLDPSRPTLDKCIPRGSILEAVDRYFWEYTDIPREVPFFYVLHYVLATLLQRGVEIHKGGQVILPDLWTVVVADSGSGKTLSQKQLDKALSGGVKLFSDAKSSLQFLTNLREQRLALYIKDEFAQFLKAVTKDPAMLDVRDYLLRTYDNGNIEHTTTKSSVQVDNSAIGILGYTPTKTLKTHLTQEMLLDGFAQRYSYCVAERDERPIIGDYKFEELASRIFPLWKTIIGMPIHPIYKISNDSVAVFDQVVNEIVTKARQDDIEDSFSRRLAFTTYKYGLAYHILSGKTSDVIDPDDMNQGAQLVALHLRDLRKILDMYEVNPAARSGSISSSTVTPAATKQDLAHATPKPPAPVSNVDRLAKVKAFLEKQKAANAAPIKLSKLQSSIRVLRGSAPDTRLLAEQAVEQDPSLAPFVIM